MTQREFQEGIARLLDSAAAAARLDRADWVTQEGGDSVFAVLPEKTYEPALIDTFMPALYAGLRAFNHNRVPRARLRLRAAVHFGTASLGANGFVGRAPVEIGRILDSAPLRRALELAPDACLAVAVSATVYDDVVSDAYTSIPADEFRQVRVEEKEYRGKASIWVPGVDVRQLDLEPGRTQEPTGPANTSGAPRVRIDLEAKDIAGEATLVRTDRLEGVIEGNAKADSVSGTFVGADIRAARDEK